MKGDGTPVDGPSVPVGTNCEVTEKEKQADGGAEREGYTVDTKIDNGAFTIKEGAASATLVTVTNTYTEVPKPTPTPTPTEEPTPTPTPTEIHAPGATADTPSGDGDSNLASTGANAMLVVTVTAALLATGYVILAARRRAS